MISKPHGILGLEYHEKRTKSRAVKYRQERRTSEVIKAIKRYFSATITILDIGAADGLMLSEIKRRFPKAECIGIEYSKDLIMANEDNAVDLIQGDAHNLPFRNKSFDIINATAVIEHISTPLKMLKECYRVLHDLGICIITTPVPFFDHVATMIGHIKKEDHIEDFDISRLKKFVKESGFEVLEATKFMMSPIGFPYEVRIEKIMKSIGLGFLLLNQLVVGRKGLKQYNSITKSTKF